MKNISYYAAFLAIVSMVALTHCSDDASSLKVYMPMAKSVVNATFDVSDTVTYTATIVGADYPTVSTSAGNDITVTFKVDANQVANFNQSMGSNYTLFPSDNYSFDESGVISKGTSGTAPLQLIIKDGDKLDPFSSYVLPITIDKVNGATVNDAQNTSFFILTRSPALENLPALDRSLWTIKDKSTEEPGEGNGNGLAIDAIDGNWGSYWHSKWAGGEPAPPHYITIDMGEEKVIHGISIVDRNLGTWDHGQPKAITISLSTDGITFQDDGSFSSIPMQSNPPTEIRYFLPSFKSARYLRVTVTAAWTTNSTSIAEIYAL